MSIRDDQFEVTFWGTRGSLPTPGKLTEKYGGNTPCLSVRLGETLIIIDAGTGIRQLGLMLSSMVKKPKELYIFLLFDVPSA